MRKMKRFLAAILVGSMLFGSNGVSYAARAAEIEDPANSVEVTQETVEEDPEDYSEVSEDSSLASEDMSASESSDEEIVEEQAQEASSEEEASAEEVAAEAASEDEAEEAVQADTEAAAQADTEGAAQADTEAAAQADTEAAAQADTEAAAQADTEAAAQADTEKPAQAATEEAASVEETAAAAATVAAPEEERFATGDLEFKGEDYNITMSFDESAKIPEGSRLKVREIEKDTEEYNTYLEDTKAAVEKGVADARFFDITIVVDKDGKEVEVQPQSAVKVNITYEEAITVSEEENGEVQAIHFDEKKEEPEVLEVKTDDNTEVSEIEFDAESFSVYGVVYTVDFEYDGYTFSIPGEGTILLSALAEQLNLAEKGFSIENVKEVTFSNEELLKIEKQEGDWLLTSLKPFTSDETLTIVMTDGAKFIIKVTDAQGDALTVDVKLYDYEDAETKAFPNDFGGDDKVYAVVWAAKPSGDGVDSDISKANENTPWNVIDITTGIRGSEEFSFNVTDFYTTSNAQSDQIKSYSQLTEDEKNRLRVRIVHTTRSIENMKLQSLKQIANGNQEQKEEYEEMWNYGFNGFELSSDHPSGPSSDGSGHYSVNFKQANFLEHDVALKFKNPDDMGEIPGGKQYVILEATSSDGNKKYHYIVKLEADGTKDLVEFPLEDTWSNNQKFSRNWRSITATVVTPNPGVTIQTGGVEPPASSDYTVSPYAIGNYTYEYRQDERTDNTEHIHHMQFLFELEKINLKDALTPEKILGDEAVEYGIVADTYKQSVHTETNFAVNTFSQEINQSIEIDGSGDTEIPFYVGTIEKELWIAGGTTVDCDVYVGEGSKEKIRDTTSAEHTVNVIPKSESSIKTYVDKLIEDGRTESGKLADPEKTTIKPTTRNKDCLIDTRQLPDGKTIYVDCTEIADIIENSGWHIYKLPGQSIVFNVPGKGNVTIGEFYVHVYNEDGTLADLTNDYGNPGNPIQSTTDRLNGNKCKNQAADDVVMQHITFNAYEAEGKVTLKNVTGLFLLPYASEVVQDNGGGWILTGGTVNSSTEWHFYRHIRHYRSKGDFSLSGQKKIVEGDEEKNYSEFASKTFTFNLYECNEHGVIVKDEEEKDKVLDTTKASSTEGSYGQFSFNKLKYTQADFAGVEPDPDTGKRTKNFYYVVKEVIPEGGKDGDVKYNAAPVYLKVEATDTPGADGGEGTISFKVFTSDGVKNDEGQLTWTVVAQEPTTGTDDNKVYKIGDFSNTVVGDFEITTNYVVTKKWIGKVPTSIPAGFDVKLYADRTVSGEVRKVEVTAAKEINTESHPWKITFKNLPVFADDGTVIHYTAEETCPSDYDKTKTDVVATQYTLGDPTNPVVTNTCSTSNFDLTSEANLAYVIIKKGNDYYIWTQRQVTADEKDALRSVGRDVYHGGFSIPDKNFWHGFGSHQDVDGNKIDFSWSDGKIVLDFHNPSVWSKFAVGQFQSSYDPGKTDFENTYKTGSLQITKKVNGDNAKGSYKIAVKNSEGHYIGTDGTDLGTEASEAVYVTFAKDQVQTWSNLPAGTYVVEEQNADVTGYTWTVSGDDNVTVAAGGTASAEVVNTYVEWAKEQIKAKKIFNGRTSWLATDSFTFTLTAATNTAGEGVVTPMPSGAETAEDGSVFKEITVTGTDEATFGEITYDTEGTYTYTVAEKVPAEEEKIKGVSYDGNTYTVTVTVSKDPATGNLTAVVEYPAEKTSVEITNTYTATGTATVKVGKKLVGKKLENDAFTFTLAAENPADAPLPEERTATNQGGEVTFASIPYTLDDAGQTYIYKITETGIEGDNIEQDTTEGPEAIYAKVVVGADNEDGSLKESKVTYYKDKDCEDPLSSATFINRYVANGSVVIVGKKELEGGKLTEGQFTFKLQDNAGNDIIDSAGNPVTARNAKDGTVTFPAISYTLSDMTYNAERNEYKETVIEYKVVEVKGTDKTIIYDTTPKAVTVTLKDNGKGTITATAAPAGEQFKFTVSNKVASVSESLKARKNYNNWEATPELAFEFKLTAGSNTAEGGIATPMPAGASGGVVTKNATKGQPEVDFGSIKYTVPGIYNYTIQETDGKVPGVTYDTVVHNVVVTVTRDENTNELTKEVKYDGGPNLTISNNYATATAHIEVTKDYIGDTDWEKAERFEFTLTAGTNDTALEVPTPMPAGAENGELKKYATKGNVTAVFGDITYEETGVYNYTIQETDGGVDGVSYDTKAYPVRVTVSTNAEGIKVTDVKYIKEEGESDSLTITNTFKTAKAQLEVSKHYEGDAEWGRATSFTFELEPGDSSIEDDEGNAVPSPMPAGITGEKETKTVTKGEGTADPKAVFSQIEYDRAGTYEYTITEVNDHVDGVSYNTTPYKATVVVSKDPDTNELSAEVKYGEDESSTLTITNTFKAVTAHLEASKHYEGDAEWGRANSFTFELTPGTSTIGGTIGTSPMPAGVTDRKETKTVTKGEGAADPTAVFSDIKYDRAGTYEYTITEVNDHVDGVSYDTTPYKATVEVSKDPDTNELSAEVTYVKDEEESDSLTITNTFTAVTAHLEVSKHYEGDAEWGRANSFTFELEPGDSSIRDSEGNAVPSPMPAGITGAKETKTVTKGEGTADPKAVFSEIEYDKAGTYEYTITEVNDHVDGVSYDTTPYKATVVVSKNPDTNELSAKVTYVKDEEESESLTITNTFEAATAFVKATKSFNAWGKADKFTFILKAGESTVGETKGTSPMPEGAEDGKLSKDATEAKSTANFGEIKYDKAGTYEYTITEQDDGVDGVSYDTDEHHVKVTVSKADDATNKLTAVVEYDGVVEESKTISNSYEGANATLQAKKDFNAWGKADKFTFILEAGESTIGETKGTSPMPEDAEDGKISREATYEQPLAVFGSMAYDKAGTYKYKITEVNDHVDGVTYDTEEHEAVVTVTKGEKNKLTAEVTYDGKKAEFQTIENTFTAAKAHFEATKEFKDWDKATEFTFILEAGKSTVGETTGTSPMPEGTEGKIRKTVTEDDPKAVFDEIEYDKAGTYEYTITEVNGKADGVSYDVTPHKAVVIVTKDKDTNALTPEVRYDDKKDPLKITNTFTSVKAKIEATKVFKGRDWAEADEFEFELAAVTEGAPMPEKTILKVTKGNQKAVFGDMEFVKTGDYEYTVTEKKGTNKGITYDTTPHKVTVKVTKAEDATNELKATVDYGEAGLLEITNTYEAEGHIVLEAQKELKGETGKVLKPEQFSFELYEGGTLLQTVKNSAEGKVTFDEITYTKPGTYYYTIKEKVETKPGYTFDTNEKKVTVKVTDNLDGTMTCTAAYDGGSALFTNTYEARGSVSLKAHKTLENRKLDDKQFIFELYNEFGVKVQTVYNDASGNVTFSSISYKKPGKYNYTIKELVQNKKGYTFDSSEKKAVVTVTDLDNGILAVKVTYDGSDKIPEFINKYEASVKVSKTDVANGKELEGAKIQIIDKDGKVVAEWTSTKKAQEVTGLKTGETYTLHEEVAPDGYTIAADTTFTIDESGKVTSTGTITKDGVLLVEDSLTSVKVSKVDVADGEELEGAKIQIIDKDGKVVAEWTSTKEAHEVKGLKTGETYTLHEVVAPDGYTVASDTTFTIDENGKVTSTGTVTEGGVMLVEDAMTVVKVSKVDIADGEELEGAKIQIIDENGKVVDEWTSTKDVHEVKGLKTGVKYTLHEEVAPDGYTVATDTTFTIDENGKVTSTGTVTEGGVMLVEDAMTVVKVSKVDVADGKELEGAKIQIIDENGKVVAEWTSTKEAHEVKGLKTGVKYTLHEVVAPNGYEIAADTTFTIDKYGKITSSGTITKDGVLLVEDAKKEEQHKKTKKKDSTRTGDEAPLGVLFGGLGIGAAGLAVLLEDRKRRNRNKE